MPDDFFMDTEPTPSSLSMREVRRIIENQNTHTPDDVQRAVDAQAELDNKLERIGTVKQIEKTVTGMLIKDDDLEDVDDKLNRILGNPALVNAVEDQVKKNPEYAADPNLHGGAEFLLKSAASYVHILRLGEEGNAEELIQAADNHETNHLRDLNLGDDYLTIRELRQEAEEHIAPPDVPPPPPPPEPEDEPDEGPPQTFRELHTAVQRERDPRTRADLVDQREALLEDIELAGAINLLGIEARIRAVLDDPETNRNNVNARLLELGRLMRDEDRDFYNLADEYVGIGTIIVGGVARVGGFTAGADRGDRNYARQLDGWRMVEIPAPIDIDQDLIEDAFTRAPRPAAAAPVAGGLGRGAGGPVEVRVVEGGNPLSAEGQYKGYQKDEEWAKNTYEKIDREKSELPLYYGGEEMTDLERDEIDARRELNNAAHYKRYDENAVTLDGLSKNKDMAGISKKETEMLMEMPGVWEALCEYVDLVESDRTVGRARYSITEAKDVKQMMVYRRYIRERVAEAVVEGYGARGKFDGLAEGSPEWEAVVEKYSRDAEQIAFNLHYVANYFESADNRWETIPGRAGVVRVHAPKNESPAVNVPIKGAMNPLNNLVEASLKARKSYTPVGAFGKMAYEQIQISKSAYEARTGRTIREYDEVVVLPSTNEYKDKFWTIEEFDDDKVRLYVFECYRHEYLKSAWEENAIKTTLPDGTEQKVTLLDHMRAFVADRDTRIPFNRLEAEGIWSMYNYKISKQAVIWDYLQGKKPLSFGKGGGGGSKEWVNDVSATLAKFAMASDYDEMRRILYASIGVKTEKRAPQMAGFKPEVELEVGRLHDFMPVKELFYPWDQLSLIQKFF